MAGNDARTMVQVASASVVTTNDSINTRDNFMDVKSGGVRNNTNRNNNTSAHDGKYHRYNYRSK
jgi:hypothetical protein